MGTYGNPWSVGRAKMERVEQLERVRVRARGVRVVKLGGQEPDL
jgi:hypothetical protein